jgi:alpha-beta hydrolase superfamily lysophospholipase
MPVALIWGEHDGLFTLDSARAMAAALPGAGGHRLYVLHGCGHAVHLECPRALVAALQRVRREIPLAPPGVRRELEAGGPEPKPAPEPVRQPARPG